MVLWTITIYNSSGGTVTHQDSSDACRVKRGSRDWHWPVNHPKRFAFVLENDNRTAAENPLSGSYAAWSSGGPEAIGIGTRVKYALDNVSGTSLTVFFGFITEYEQNERGELRIVTKDYMEKYETITGNKIVYDAYTDFEALAFSDSSGVPRIYFPTLTPHFPLVAAYIPENNDMLQIGRSPITASTATPPSDTGSRLDGATLKVAQPLKAHDVDGWVRVMYNAGATNTADLKYSLQTDDGGAPSGTIVGSCYDSTALTCDGAWHSHVFVPTAFPTLLERDRRYWLVFEPTGTTTTCDIMMGVENDANYLYSPYAVYKSYDGASWSAHSGYNILATVYYEEFRLADQTGAYVSGSYYYLPAEVAPVMSGGVGNAARVCYYSGTVTLEDVFDAILAIQPDDVAMTTVTSTDLDRTLSLYHARGRPIGECLRELCQVVETSGPYAGYQHAIGHYESGGTHYITVGIAYRSNATAAFTFAHPSDSVTDSQHKIVSLNLAKKSANRPATVVVIGRGYDGTYICAARDDRPLGASSFRTKSKCALTRVERDDDIHTLAEADKRAYEILDSYSRDTWEGTITVKGMYPDVIQLTTASVFYGAGKVIDVQYSPIGLSSATSFVVKGVRCLDDVTEITITNDDPLVANRVRRTIEYTNRSAGFEVPSSPTDTIFLHCYINSTITDATVYARLLDSGSTVLTDMTKVLCTKMANTSYNANVYHCEFSAHNGYGAAAKVRLYDSADATLGTYSMHAGETFYKGRKCTVLADVICDAS